MGECCNSICKTYIIFLLSLYLCFMTSLGIICATWNGEIKNNFKTIHKRAYILEMRTVVHMQGCVQLCDPMDCSMPGFPVLHYLPEFAQTHVHWVDEAIQPSHPVIPFSCCPQSFPASRSFPLRWLFLSGSQSIGVSASVIKMNILGWFPLLTGLISLQPKGLSRVFSSTTVWKHQFFGTQPSLWSNSHIRMWLLEKP